MTKKLLLAILLWLPVSAAAQYNVWSQPITNNLGQPIVATVAVCNGASQPSLVVPCGGSSLATIYAGFSGGTQFNPFFTNSSGLATVYASSGNYYLQVYGSGLQTTIIPITIGGGGFTNPFPGPLQVSGSSLLALTPDPYCGFNLSLYSYPPYICALTSGQLNYYPNQPSGGGQTFLFANSANSFIAPQILANVNAVLNPAACSLASPPSWCSGSEIGGWVNSAIAALPSPAGSAHCGEIYLPAGSWTQTTSILMPRCVKWHGASAQGTRITWGNSSGWAVIVADNNVPLDNNYDYYGALEDLSLLGPGVSNTAGAIYIGGSDGVGNSPSTTLDPATNFGDHFIISRVRIFQPGSTNGFNVGVQFGTNAWSDTIWGSDISFSGTNISLPGTMTSNNSGEDITINNSTIGHATGVGISLGTSVGAFGVNLNVMNTSLDFNTSWQIQNGTAATQDNVSLSNVTIYAPDHWVQNYGPMSVFAAYFAGGGSSGTLGYLIDNETSGALWVSTGGSFFNSGSGHIENSAGQAGTWIAPFVTGTAISFANNNIDRFGNAAFQAAYANTLNQNAANKMAGVSACVSNTKAISLSVTYGSQPVILVFDETTKGGANLSAKSTSGFTVSCTGATDTFDWMVVGNPN